MAVLSEDEAVCTSDKVARDPEPSTASVRRRVPFDHTSDTNVPNVVIEREPYDQIVAGKLVIMLPIEVEALDT